MHCFSIMSARSRVRGLGRGLVEQGSDARIGGLIGVADERRAALADADEAVVGEHVNGLPNDER